MSHQEQNKGFQSPHQNQSYNAAQMQADQLSSLQQQSIPQIHMNMGNLNQQAAADWHHYYAQIGAAHSRQQQMPFIEHSQFPMAYYPTAGIQQRNAMMIPAEQQQIVDAGIFRSPQPPPQPHHQLYQQQPQHQPTASVSDLASLAQQAQQHLIMTQQQYLQQHHQQQQHYIENSQEPMLNPHLLTNSIQQSLQNNPSTSAAKILSAISQQSPQLMASTPQNPIQSQTATNFQQQVKKKSDPIEQQRAQNIRTKTPPENAHILAQKELEAIAELKAQEAVKKSQAVQDDLKRKQLDAKEHAQTVKEHIQSFNEPIHLAGCHTLSKVSTFLPFPTEMASTSTTLLPCFDQQQANLVLSNADLPLANYLGVLLADTTDHIQKIKLKHEEVELDNLEGLSKLPALIQAIQSTCKSAFSINDESDDLLEAQNYEPEEQNYAEISSAEPHQTINYSTNPDSSVAGVQLKKKKEAESLHDSLSGYFSTNQQGRSRVAKCHNSNDDEDGVSTTSMERGFGAENEEPAKKPRKRQREPTPETLDSSSISTMDTPKKEPLLNRPPTPTDVIQQREIEWNERQRQREEKYRRRQQQQQTNTANTKLETWNVDAISEQESFCRFQSLVDQILEQAEEAKNSMPSTTCSSEESGGVLLECNLLEELRIEAQKLKSWKKLWNIPVEKLVKLLGIMEKNIRDILTEDGSGLAVHAKMKTSNEDESDETLRELIDDRLLRSVDAALVAMCIMTSKRVPKQVLMEDVIEHSIKLCKNYMQDVICVADSSSIQAKSSRKSAMDTTLTSKRQKNYNTTLYMRLVDLMGYFSELVRFHNFHEVLLFSLSSLGTPPFFIENVPEMQMQAIKLLPLIFAKSPNNTRKSLLSDLLNSLHKLPTQRNARNTYRLNATESISNFTVLILQLIQSIVQLPSKKTSSHSHHHFRGERDSKATLVDDLDDRFVMDLFEEAKKIAAYFLGGFLAKCTAKAEDDYRRLFEQFLQDILVALYRPMWPVAELIIMVLGNLLVVHYRTKTYDLSLRVASLDYLGIIAARLRKDRVHVLSEDATAQDKARLNSIVKSLLFDEKSYDPAYNNVDEIDISNISQSEKVRKLEQALFDYIIGTMWDGDLSVEYILLFYAVEWYRETVLDVEVCKEKYAKSLARGEISNREKQKCEQKMLRIADKGQEMKLFIIGLMDKQHLKRRMQMISKSGNIMVENDANWVVKYLASKKELSQSFDIYLRKILEGFNSEMYPVAIRAKAMKCLAQIIEADYQVLMIPEVNKIVQERLIDANASVREATFDLIGKCLVSKPELLETYYSILINRTKDTAVAVRKRVIRILREIVFLDASRNQNLERNSQILSGILQRINDEEGVKKMCMETFQQLWMQPTHDRSKLEAKICLLVETAKCSITDGALEYFDTLISTLLQSQEHGTLVAAKQLVDALVEHILFIEKRAVEEQKTNSSNKKVLIDSTVNYQARLFATLTSLSIIAKARPELLIRHIEVFLPYLSALSSSTMESNMVNQIIIMLEQIISLMAIHDTSNELIKQIETKLNEIVKDGGMLLIASAISCMSAIYEKFNQGEQPGICRLFIIYYKYIEKCKRENEYERQQTSENNAPSERKPNLLRALYSMGLMCRYFDFDALLTKNQLALLQMDEQKNGNGTPTKNGTNEESEAKGNEIGIVKLSAFSLLFYFSRSPDYQISQKALIALGQLTAGFPIFLRRDELKNMYLVLLSSDNCSYLQLKVQVLKNIACFLYTEEQKALKRAKQTKLEKQQKQQEDASTSMFVDSSDEQSQPAIMDVDDLKETELSSSGLSSSIIQQYWNAILKCYFHNDENVRMNSAQVIRQTLEQGLVTPGSSIPTLIAMSTDSSGTIRTRVEVLIRDMNTKYKGLILSKAIPGVRLAFQLQKKLRSHSGQCIRGIRANENPLNPIKAQDKKSLPSMSADIQSLLGNFYVNIRKNRQSRRNFLISLLKFFSEEHKEKIEREECLFIADNLAHFPYTVMDEPLYVIYHANSIISISGQNILSQFRQLLIKPPTVYGSHQPQQFNNSPMKMGGGDSSLLNASMASDEQEEEFSVQYIIDHLPPDRSLIYELKRNSQACFILLHLKTFLMRLYGLKEDKCTEYSPSEAANVYEKPINRRNIPAYSNEVFDEFLNEQQGRNDVAEEKRKIAEDFHKFHEMLLSLDERRDDDEAEASSMLLDATQNNNSTIIVAEEGDSNNSAAATIEFIIDK